MSKKNTNVATKRVIATYSVQRYPVEFVGGWYLECYDIYKYSNGDYKVLVQAGDRTGGASREFPLPASLIHGPYDEFLDNYLQIVPAGHFGLSKKELLADGQLKAFLGLAERKDHPEVTIVDKPAFALIGESNYCPGAAGHPIKETYEGEKVPEELCESIETHYDELSGMCNRHNGEVPAGVWGVMSREKVEKSFKPWIEFYRSGYYFAGVEADMKSVAKGAWEKWVIPQRTFVLADVREDNYENVIDTYVNQIIPEMGMILNGGICEYIEFGTKKTTLYFPVMLWG